MRLVLLLSLLGLCAPAAAQRAVRQPSHAEARAAARACGTSAVRARMPGGLLRLAPEGVFQPVASASPAQRRCFARRIRALISRPRR